MTDVLETTTEGAVRILRLNRPEVRNALDLELLGALVDALEAAEEASEVRAVVVTGADPAFCAGLDLRAVAAGELSPSDPHGPRPLPDVLLGMRTPVIGAVNGVAVTGGLELALLCDLLVASDRARFADTHARVGIHPGWGLTALLPQAVGLRYARQMSFTGNYVDAEEAARVGLVNAVVPHEELMPRALALAADIAGNDPRAVRAIADTYQRVAATTLEEGLALERERFASWQVDPEEVARRREAVTARGRAQTTEGP